MPYPSCGPQVHATRKGLKKHKKVDNQMHNKEAKKLSSWRKAPETTVKKGNYHRAASGRRMRRRKATEDEQIRNVKLEKNNSLPDEKS